MIKKSFTSLAFSLLLVAGLAQADVLVSRGLPTANLNVAAGGDRSNVTWSEGGPPSSGAPYALDGDTFTNTSSGSWHISNIRLWVVRDATSASLWGGVSGGALSQVSASGTFGSPVLYANGESYQRTSGPFSDIRPVDFAVDILLGAGETYSFFFDGTGGTAGVPFVHATNAALSGVPQDSADNLMLTATLQDGSLGNVATWRSNQFNVWDKDSDINVEVMGTVPEPTSMVLMALGLAGLGLARGRAQKA